MSAKWWTEAWNPVVGCTPASAGCDNCYAKRLHDQRRASLLAGKRIPDCYRQPFEEVTCIPKRLDKPFSWHKPRRMFVNSMSDLFHPDVPDEFLDEVFAVMAMRPQHTFMVLTKRAEAMREYIAQRSGQEWRDHLAGVAREHFGSDVAECQVHNAIGDVLAAHMNVGWPMRNIWLGVTAENQEQADRRIPVLLDTPAAKRFVSIEPMLWPVDLGRYLRPGGPSCPHVDSEDGTCSHDDAMTPECHPGSDCPMRNGRHLDWVICGGETGNGARPVDPSWPRTLRDQCQATSVPFYFKQWGDLVWTPVPAGIQKGKAVFCHFRKNFIGLDDSIGSEHNPDGFYASLLRRSGRILDGREHLEIPGVAS